MLIRYPRRVTVNNKRIISKPLKSEKKYAYYTKGRTLLRITKENYSNNIGPWLLGFYYKYLSKTRNVFANFDEILSMTVQRY